MALLNKLSDWLNEWAEGMDLMNALSDWLNEWV